MGSCENKYYQWLCLLGCMLYREKKNESKNFFDHFHNRAFWETFNNTRFRVILTPYQHKVVLNLNREINQFAFSKAQQITHKREESCQKRDTYILFSSIASLNMFLIFKMVS